MLLTSLLSALASLIRPRPVRDNAEATARVLDELFAVWPLDPEEERALRARYASQTAALRLSSR
ncbi:hypothetical protein [Rubellimicrobium aerolatum]|uniref:Uncharacterized protein n=1 Tax=Rubellimicrobium aerolatum TaxID=490979 RepID=A0ABW0SCN3_9RHOB|nr:hypothetical protein [Rubellimicrobium aerolatum]MBP1806604.1 hypothetical protein [Rubellimicrobium aerolatum]